MSYSIKVDIETLLALIGRLDGIREAGEGLGLCTEGFLNELSESSGSTAGAIQELNSTMYSAINVLYKLITDSTTYLKEACEGYVITDTDVSSSLGGGAT